MNFDYYSLQEIRNQLIRLEDTIIFALIERSQFALNPRIYTQQFKELNKTFLEYFLHELECVHAKVRRYTSPDEHPFTADLPAPILPELNFPKILAPNSINLNAEIMDRYIKELLPLITSGEDSNWGSSCTKDCTVLESLSRRIHFGKFVAEAKFNDPKLHDQYVDLIKKKDSEGLMRLLTNERVEQKLLRRVKRKVLIYGQEIDDQNEDLDGDGGSMPTLRISPQAIASMYEEFIIPMTKKVEVLYLLQRLDTDFVSYNKL
jgi:chorismate mutase